MRIKVGHLRKIISGAIQEICLKEDFSYGEKKRISSVPPQHPKFNSVDLYEIAEEIANTLERRGYEIEKSDSSFEKSALFDAHGKGKSYKVVLRKKQKIHIVSEDADFGIFDRNDPELSAFLKGVKKSSPAKPSPEKKNNAKNIGSGTLFSPVHTNQRSQLDDFENDDTVLGLSREKFRMSTKFEYIVEFLDMTKNNSCAFRIVKDFITNEKENPTKDPEFKRFSMKLLSKIGVMIAKAERSSIKRNDQSIDLD